MVLHCFCSGAVGEKFWVIIPDSSYRNLVASRSEFYNGVLGTKGSVISWQCWKYYFSKRFDFRG